MGFPLFSAFAFPTSCALCFPQRFFKRRLDWKKEVRSQVKNSGKQAKAEN